MVIYYLFALCILAALNIVILFRLYPRQNGPYALIFLSAFISCVGFLMMALSSDLSEVLLANKMNYVGAIFLPLFSFFAILQICQVKAPNILRTSLTLLAFVVYGLSATVGYSDIYYSSAKYIVTYGAGNFEATYGPGHTLFNLMLAFYVCANLGVLIYAFLKKKNVSFKCLVAFSLLQVATIISFFLARFLGSDTLVMPAVYVFDQFVMLYICNRIKRYDITQSVVDALEENNTDSYVSVSSNMKFLGSNDIAYSNFPELGDCRVDHTIDSTKGIVGFLLEWVRQINSGEAPDSKDYEIAGKHYKITIKQITISKKITTNLFKIEEDTQLHRYITMLGSNNDHLETMVKDNANKIQTMQQQMMVGLASMVESRDSNTGGHIKRTSDVIAILVNELRRDKELNCSKDFLDALVKAAPMHDLGKIAIDDQILRKPGRFTPEEYEVMKTHSQKGAVIVENLLSQVQDPDFVKIACNVANYHHERFDGKGYPNGLVGEQIPFEARIMAVADVYDALVSKRHYKDEFSFEKAFGIITEGMGTQFDPKLWKCFYNSRAKLEEYYSRASTQSHKV